MKARIRKKKDSLRQKRKEKLIAETVPQLRHRIFELEKGAEQMRKALDALLIQTTITWGTAERDEETGEILGWRLLVPNVPIEDTLAAYALKASPDKDNYTLGVFRREET